MTAWQVERVVHIGPGDFIVDGFSHFGLHARNDTYYAIVQERHRLEATGSVAWTAAARAGGGRPRILTPTQ